MRTTLRYACNLKGSISFWLANIPIALYPATRREELKFRLLRRRIQSGNYKRVAEKDGKEVPWEQIVKGYEYEKGKFIVLKEKDFDRVDLEATKRWTSRISSSWTKSIRIFFTSRISEPQRAGTKLRVIARCPGGQRKGRIAKVVIKTRQICRGESEGQVLVLELMHFEKELADAEKLKVPKKMKLGKREMDKAKSLVEEHEREVGSREISGRLSRSADGSDRGESGIRGKGNSGETKTEETRTKVIDLVAVLQQSLAKAKAERRKRVERSSKGGKKKRRPRIC